MKRRVVDAQAFAPRDTKAQAAARKAQKRSERTDGEYLAWVRLQPCAVGGDCRGAVCAHHEPPRSHSGDWHDHRTVSLCDRHHTQRHFVLGPRLFAEKYGICLLARALELRGRYLTEHPDED